MKDVITLTSRWQHDTIRIHLMSHLDLREVVRKPFIDALHVMKSTTSYRSLSVMRIASVQVRYGGPMRIWKRH